MPKKKKLSGQLSIIVIVCRRDNSLVHKLRVMAAVELDVNGTYYAQHPTLESVYGKGQSVIGGQLFSSYRTVFSTGGLLKIPKQVT